MAEASESLSSYNYAGNNPIRYNDPLGDYAADGPRAYQGYGSSPWTNPGIPYSVDGVLIWPNGGSGDGFASDCSCGGGNVGGSGVNLPPPPGSDAFIALLSNPDWVSSLPGATSIDLSHDADYNIYKNGDVRVQRYGTGYGDVIDWKGSDVYFTQRSANAGGAYPTGFRQFASLIIGESSADHPTSGESAGIASTIINRINAVGGSLYDPKWMNKVGTSSAYNGVETARYKLSMGMSIDQIAAKYPTQFAGILQAYNNWGTDYGGNANPSYYWTAAGLKSGYAYDQYMSGNMIRNTVGSTTFYAFKVGTWQWTP
ncbi:MAG: hypothetical protein JWR09_3211 [Mucilaginibacter sp.]|nr:hypothetical protein [Mucilaginibacter sp.]